MNMRALGGSGIEIAPLMLGGNVFGWTADEKASFAVLDAFVDGGGNAIDTADIYSVWIPGHVGGESETMIGKWFKASGKRDKVVLTTKVGMKLADGKEGLSARWIEQAVEDSLRRLQTDRIDLYLAHADDLETPLEETLKAFDRLVKSGKVRAIGCSNYEAPRLAEALDTAGRIGTARYTVLQPWFNLLDRDKFEGPLQDLCVERGIGVIPYFGLASGFLSGKYRSEADLAGKPRAYRAKDYLNERGLRVLAALDQVAEAHKATPAQVALAWLAAQPAIVAPIASATSVAQVEDLLGSMRLTLTSDELAALDKASMAT